METLTRRISSALLTTLLLAAVALLVGCAPTYAPGALFAAADTPTHAVRRRGCVDIAVSLGKHDRIPASSVLVTYALANGCDEGRTVDLSRAVVVGQSAGQATRLVAFDPTLRQHTAVLDGRRTGSEAIRYDAPAPAAEGAFEEVCVDLRGIAGGADDGFGVVCMKATGDVPVVDRETPGIHRALEACSGPQGYGPSTRECWTERYDWDVSEFPRLRADFGLAYRSFQVTDAPLWRSGTGSFRTNALGKRLDGGTLDLRMAGFVTRAVYVGGEFDVGFGGAPSVTIEPAPSTVSTGGLSAHVLAGAHAGVLSERRGPLQVRGEVFVGGRLLVLTAREANGAQATGYLGGGFMLEPRVFVDVWAMPDLSVSAWGGADVTHLGDWSTGLALTFHSRSFDAR
jgi:hypothetical protein